MSRQKGTAIDTQIAHSTAYVRLVNERTVFKRVYDLAPTSVTQLVERTGLSKPTVGLALARLEQVRLVQKVGVRTGRAGRSPQLFGPRPDAGWVVSVDVGRRFVGVLLADLTGTVVTRIRERSQRSGRGLVDQIGSMVDRVLSGTDVAPEAVLNVVVGSPGVYDPSGARIRYAANIPGWERPDLVVTLRERLGEYVVVENDANLAALGEQAYGLGRGVDNFVYLHIGAGVGLGAVLGGRLHRGARGAAGEAAFLPVAAAPTGAEGRSARRRGLLESVAAADGLVAAARHNGVPNVRSARDVLASARKQHPAAVRTMEQQMEHLTAALAAIIALFDPELVVFGGGIGRHLGDYLEHLRRKLADLLPLSVPAFAPSALDGDAKLMGGLASGLATARERAFAQAASA